MIRNHIFGFIFLLAAGILLNSCKKNYLDLDTLSDEIEINPQLVAPLIYGSMTMTDITELFDSVDYIGEFDDNLIYFAYSESISVSADTAMGLMDTIKAAVIYLESDSDVILPGVPGDTTEPIMRSKGLEFEMPGENRLDEILVKDGFIGIDITSTFKHEAILTVSSQQILDESGNPFRHTINIDDASGGYNFYEILDSEGLTIMPDHQGESNSIFIDFELQIINSGAPILAGERCSIQFSLFEFDFYHIYGFLDTKNLLDESGSVDIPIWEDNPDLKAITFADPRFVITSASSVGIPFEVDLDSLIAVGSDGEQVFLSINDGNTLGFNAPGFDQQGETVTTVIEINNTSSNIDDFLALAPSSITYSIEGRTSTNGDDTTHFVLNESQLDLGLEFLLPLDFRSTGFALTDTMDFILEEGVDTSLVKNAEISITTVNELPVELMLQVLLLDENHLVIDSVFNDNAPILAASLVDDLSGKLVEASEETNRIEFPAEKLGKLDQVFFMQVRARLLTSNDGEPFVKIYSYYTLDFEISLLANFRINTREL